MEAVGLVLAQEAWNYAMTRCAFINPETFMDGETIVKHLDSAKMFFGDDLAAKTAFNSFWFSRNQHEKGGRAFVFRKFRQYRSSFTQTIVSGCS